MKIALSQLNYHIGNFEGNYEKVVAHIRRAEVEGVSLVVFAELALSGYPARDFLEQREYIEKCLSWLARIAAECTNVAAIIGGPSFNTRESGKDLFNSAFYLYKGEVKDQVNKALLPTYDIFDEYRYFEPETSFHCVTHEGTPIALTICEDLWNIVDPLYVTQPMEALMKQHPKLMINIAASPFNYTQAETRLEILRANALKYGLPLVYVNHVGAQTEIVFDGGSMVLDKNGQVLVQLASFMEDFTVVELFDQPPDTNQADLHDFDPPSADTSSYRDDLHAAVISVFPARSPASVEAIFLNSDYTHRIYQACVLGIRDYFQKLGFKNAVLGLSGGIDSAVVCALATEALGSSHVTAVLLPSRYSSDHSIKDARDLVDALGTKSYIIPITNVALAFEETLSAVFQNLPAGLAEENIQARSRSVILMALSNKLGMVLLNTSNKSEAAVGYGTLYGDMAGALSAIGDLYKTQVYELARFINREREIIPVNTLLKPPSAELRPDQKDSDSLPEYDVLDQILYLHIEKKEGRNTLVSLGYDATTVDKTLSLVNIAEFKRYQSAPILRVSPKSFGMGRRMPIVGKY